VHRPIDWAVLALAGGADGDKHSIKYCWRIIRILVPFLRGTS
jgi:hypothetical protein